MTRNRDFVRVREADRPLIRVSDKKSLDQAALKSMPAQYLKSIENNNKLKPCCRDTSRNYSYEMMKTDENLEGPNLAIFTCTECGCRHFRAAAIVEKPVSA